ncbi:MAG TPA: carbohydrate binding family 9 domain-containing protein, partial [Anaeromyxobacteraceae bacterium]|nr:carbohydrate binding family 9 domain-containing protein [Anaeromyxobacteraceae bacterium]
MSRGDHAPGQARCARPQPARAVLLLATALACAVAPVASALESATIVATRTSKHVELDGRLDDEAWSAAPVFSEFVESFPRPGIPAAFRTEVRVLYDAETLYVGVVCSDPAPAGIVRQLARRDSDPASDRVEVALDTGSNRHTAYDFIVNAAGVLRDQLLFA